MKRIITIICVFLVCLSSVTAIKVKFMNHKIDSKCVDVIYSIPSEYYSGVSRIAIYKNLKDNAAGMFSYPSRQISLRADSCNEEVIRHELAHSFQWAKYGWNESYCIRNHCGHWQQEWDYARKI